VDLALLIIAAKAFLGFKKDRDADPCSGMTEGSPAHVQCLIAHRK